MNKKQQMIYDVLNKLHGNHKLFSDKENDDRIKECIAKQICTKCDNAAWQITEDCFESDGSKSERNGKTPIRCYCHSLNCYVKVDWFAFVNNDCLMFCTDFSMEE